MQNSSLPPDVVDNILQVVSYVVSVAIGWLAKWLSGRKKNQDKLI